MKLVINGNTVEIKDEDLTAAIEAGKAYEIKNEDLIVRSKEEQDRFIENSKKEIINTALEMEVKKWRNDLGLEFEGKTFENLINAVTEKNKSEFTKEPSEQLTAKEKDIETLKGKIKELEEAKKGIETEYSSFKNTSFLNTELEKYMPKDIALPKEDMLLLLKTKLSPDVQDGKVVFKKDGEILKDSSTLDPLAPKTVFENFFAENKHYLKGMEGGQGGSDSNPDNKSTFDVFVKKMESVGIAPGSYEFNEKMSQAIQNKEIDASDVK